MSDAHEKSTALFLKPAKLIVFLFVLILILGGIAVRLIDLDDLPLDFAATRQLHSFIMARGLYFEMDTPETNAIPEAKREFAIIAGRSEPQIEPPVMEYMVAMIYRIIGGENMLVARLLSISFWIIGGIPLFLLARKFTTINGSLIALAIYLFIPFGTIASRSFQPDPLMVMLIIWAQYFQHKWLDDDKLSSAIFAGLFTGLAVLIKTPAVFFVGFTMIAVVFLKGFVHSLRDWRVYLVAGLSLIPALVFYTISATAGGNAGAIFGARWVPALFSDPKWYLQWFSLAKYVVGYFPIILGLLGFFLINEKKSRVFYFCMWFGYLLYGFMFAYHIYTHDYYHLPLIPIVALGVGVVGGEIFVRLESRSLNWVLRSLVILLLLFSIGLAVMNSRGRMIAKSYRHEAKYWQELGELIGQDSSVIALTHDYGYRLNFWGFIQPSIWPNQGDLVVKDLLGSTDPEFETLFKLRTEGKDLFLVTLSHDFELQENLRNYLFENFPYKDGDGFYLFDLNKPLQP
ncbi:MAG: glycosyltransferase family 39 protein [Anaerolineaceae bacterium]|nr:glycosyltransferase family 39 protein [Anaerolineaceae bacterium]